MNEKQLKEVLSTINKHEFKFSSEDAEEIIDAMLTHIGSIDFELRDELIYSTLSKWIIDKRISNEKLREILERCLVNLSFGLRETESDTVFMRSFSILILTSILYYDNDINSFLLEKEVIRVYEKIVEYALSEKDLRGYVINKGWAHSVAHLADCLDELSKNRYLGSEELYQILNVIYTKVSTNHIAYSFGEDERLVTAVVSVVARNILATERVKEWLNHFSDFENPSNWPKDYWFIVNTKTFIRSLYFRTLTYKEYQWLNKYTLEVLTEINQKFPEY